MCLAQVLGMTGFMTYPALLPQLQAEWALSNAAAGWVTAVYFIGYLAAVTVLTSLTDRVDARRIYLWSMAVSVVSAAGFCFFADGMWSASLWRALQGIGLAGTYMPGLRALTDRVPQSGRSRAVAFYTANFVVGTSLSVFIAGEAYPLVGWRWTFLVSAIGPVAALAITARYLQPVAAPGGGVSAGPARRRLDFRPVFRNRGAMGYTLAYACHCWELFGLRGWMVAFLAFGLAQASPTAFGAGWSPTHIATLLAIVGLPASVLGNEAAERFGRRRVATVLMVISSAVAVATGLATTAAPLALVAIMLVYGTTVMSESSVLTAGAVKAAAEEHMGATMAVHSLIGFSGSFLGPFAFGIMLDLGGGELERIAWILGFLSLGGAVLLGPVLLWLPTFRKQLA